MTNYYNDFYFLIILKTLQAFVKVCIAADIYRKFKKREDISDSDLQKRIKAEWEKTDSFFENIPDDKSLELYEKVFPLIEKRRNEDYKKECFVFNAKKEYGEAYKGPKWIIFTDLSPVMLKVKYDSIIKKYQPYGIEEYKFAEAFKEYFRAEELNKKRESVYKVMPFEEGLTDLLFSELWIKEPFEQMCKREDERMKRKVLILCWNELTELQRKRINSYIIDRKSVERIAEEEKVSADAVYHSLKRGIVSFAKKLNKSGYFNIIYSDSRAEGA